MSGYKSTKPVQRPQNTTQTQKNSDSPPAIRALSGGGIWWTPTVDRAGGLWVGADGGPEDSC